ncbi:MAG: hypothetical protein ACNA8W_03300 [Bradymonadaceae bacterium]
MDKANTQQRGGLTTTGTTASGGELVRVYEADGAEGVQEIRSEIEAARRQIAANIQLIQDEVETRVERALDWRGFTRDHPMTTLSLAFAAGLYLGLR